MYENDINLSIDSKTQKGTLFFGIGGSFKFFLVTIFLLFSLVAKLSPRTTSD